jgi:hypothetical protein
MAANALHARDHKQMLAAPRMALLAALVRFSVASPDFLAWSWLACERRETDCD